MKIKPDVFVTTFTKDLKNAHYKDKEDELEHIASHDCWCEPEDFGDGVWVHRRTDN